MGRNIVIRQELENDHRRVEEVIRQAFYNRYTPGCTEHYLAHVIRAHPDFLPELDLVIEADGQIIGNIMYTKSTLLSVMGEKREILTFGPVSILPEYQRKGYGRQLMEESFRQAVNLEYEVIVIVGDPNNYVGCGFQSCKKHQISLEDGSYPAAMLVKELNAGTLGGRNGYTIKVRLSRSMKRQPGHLMTVCLQWRKNGCPVKRHLKSSAMRSSYKQAAFHRSAFERVLTRV